MSTKREALKIANLMEADSSIMRYVTEKGFFLDGQGKSYMQTGGKFYDAGEYNLDVHGLPVPLAQKRNKLKIASHDNKQFKSVPATGARGDTMAPDWLIDYMNRKDENLLQIQQRLKRA